MQPIRLTLMLALITAGLAASRTAGTQDLVIPQFTDVSAQSGVRFKHNFGAKNLENVLMTTASGCALFDYDNDGWLDIFFANGTFLDDDGKPRTDKATRHALFHNRGDGTFENMTRAAGLGVPSYGQGCAVGDYDGDRFPDLYLTNYGPNRLYRNRGDGTFEDVSAKASRLLRPRWRRRSGPVYPQLRGIQPQDEGGQVLGVVEADGVQVLPRSPRLRGPAGRDVPEQR
jgi:hypothetical protein